MPNRYQLISACGSGGFGSVSIYMDTHLERRVAIKTILSEGEKRRLVDELQGLMSLRSNHVVQVFDVIYEDGNLSGIVEEFVDGEDLQGSNFPQAGNPNYLKCLWQISKGLADIHAAGIIHRDVKPNNMKIDDKGIVKVFDFGLSRSIEHGAHTRGFKGTFGFAAPELFASDHVEFTPAVDVYAFGVTAIFLLNKNLPRSLLEVPPAPLTEEVVRDIFSHLDDPIQDVLLRCLSTFAEVRPSMEEVYRLLSKYLLLDRHQAIATYKDKYHYLNSGNKLISLALNKIGSLKIEYNGLGFYVKDRTGEVYINNREPNVGEEIPGSCVVSLGSASREYNERAFITFDVSNPEVVL
ncbi:serine/threonine-protein kinase [Microbulbifer sp. THAF38]|uniref:serine/threonine-protein kinase n=1 Tax=Microbulbifer sp. THAF38 TaxID=2587856 RepID=UPI0020A2A688|nr:serine/threonine-protein kinase [Microbulbifer sp. THAF38]